MLRKKNSGHESLEASDWNRPFTESEIISSAKFFLLSSILFAKFVKTSAGPWTF